MGRLYDEIDERMSAWLLRQPMFFVATAPRDGGHVNVSPKGLAGTLAVIDPTTVAYLDLGGSGAETIAHTRENGRITLMFCSFEGPPRIVRLYGTGTALYPDDTGYEAIRELFGDYRERNVIRIDVDRIADSCGYGVPEMTLVRQRTRLTDYIDARTDEELAEYQAKKNRVSIDGLPAIDPAP